MKKRLFILCSILFILHQVLQWGMGVNIPLIDAYLDPLLCMPVILFLYEWELNMLYKKPGLSLIDMVIITAYLAIAFEWVFSYFSNKFIFDPVDFIFYLAGTMMYYTAGLLDRN